MCIVIVRCIVSIAYDKDTVLLLAVFSTVFIVCSSISPERGERREGENREYSIYWQSIVACCVFMYSGSVFMLWQCLYVVLCNLPRDYTRILPQCWRRCRYRDTRTQIYYNTDRKLVKHKQPNTKRKKDEFIVTNWYIWNCSGRPREEILLNALTQFLNLI